MNISKNIKDRLLDALITAFVFAAALAWREAFVTVLNKFLPSDRSPWSEIIVAIIITGVVVFLIYLLLKSDTIVEKRFIASDKQSKGDGEKEKPD